MPIGYGDIGMGGPPLREEEGPELPPEIVGKKEILTQKEMDALSQEERKARYKEYGRNVGALNKMAMWAWERDGMPLTRNLTKEERAAVIAERATIAATGVLETGTFKEIIASGASDKAKDAAIKERFGEDSFEYNKWITQYAGERIRWEADEAKVAEGIDLLTGGEEPGETYADPAEARAAAEAMGPEWRIDYDATTSRYYIYEDPRYFDPDKEPEVMPTGMWATQGEAATAALTMGGGYVPIQTADGWWKLQRTEGAEPTRYEEFGRDPYGGQGQFNPYTGQWEEPPGYVSPYEQAQMEHLTWQQEEAQRKYASGLAAQPHSWLEYASYTGEQPAIQPWMLPLMPQQYEGMQAGQPIPGWQGSPAMTQGVQAGGTPSSMGQPTAQIPTTQDWSQVPAMTIRDMGGPFPETGESAEAYYARVNAWSSGAGVSAGATQQEHQVGLQQQLLAQGWTPEALAEHYPDIAAAQPVAQPTTQPTAQGQYSMGGMPQLTRPSRQYQARMGPTAMAQYGGYQQAQTGISPEELEWRLWSASPPSGRYSGLSRRR